MRFCTKCGRQLNDGEVCTCQAQPQQSVPVQAQAKTASPDFIGDIMEFFKTVFKKPADAVCTYVNKGSLIASLIILAVCAIVKTFSNVLYKIIANVQYEQNVRDNLVIWDPTTWVAPEPLYGPWQVGLGAVGDRFYTFASAAVMAGVMYAVIKFVFEKDSKVKFGQLFAVMALVALVQMPFSLVYTVLRYIPLAFFSRVGGWISTFGSALGVVTLFVGLNDNVKNKNNMFLVYASASVINSIMYTVLDLIGMF